jgi:hypothetical protein
MPMPAIMGLVVIIGGFALVIATLHWLGKYL